MTKLDLIEKISTTTGVDKKAVKAVVNATFTEIKNVITNKDTISIIGFGTFGQAWRGSKSGTSHLTGKTYESPAHYVPTCKFSASFREELKSIKK